MLMLNVNESVATRHDIELVDDSMFVGSDEIPGGTSYIIMNKTSSSSASDNLPPMLIVLLVILCECFLLIDIVYIFLFKKHRQSATYHILTHYMIFKLMFCFAEFFNILSSVALEETDFHLKPTDAICFMGRYFTFVAESAMNFHIVLIWVVLLSERRIIGFRSLLSDFELRNACAITPMSTSPQPPLVTPTQPSTAIMTPSPSLADNLVTANGNNTNTQEQQGSEQQQQQQSTPTTRHQRGASPFSGDSFLAKLRVRGLRTTLILNSRTISLYSFYVFVCAISVLPFSSIMAREHGFTYRCAVYRYMDGFFVLLVFVFLFFFFLPTLYWLLVLTTVFAKLFGGSRDPILGQLNEADLKHIRFVKIASLLKFAENFFLHVISTHDFALSPAYYQTTRIIGLSLILVMATLFILYENVLINVKRSLFDSAGSSSPLAGDEGSGGVSRINYFVFRNQRETDEEAIVYGNLVESA